MGYTFPSATDIFFALLDGRAVEPPGEDPEPEQLTSMLRLVAGFEAESLPVAHIRRLGGTSDGPFRTDRIAVDIYAAGTDPAQAYADQVCAFLEGHDHYVEGLGQIDGVAVETVPTEIPYASDKVSRVSGTYRADTRGQ